ncbi:MAG: hypothetical protein IPL36_11235 [Nigerium sp.]|nr:hypothetical protein [Nigerium sp.]
MNDSTPLARFVLKPLPEGWVPVGVVALIKYVDDEGDETWAFRTSEELGDEETLGALVVRTDLAKAALMELYMSTDDES